MKDGTEAGKLLKGFFIIVRNQFSKVVKLSEVTMKVSLLWGQHRILRESSYVDTPQQNERQNASIIIF